MSKYIKYLLSRKDDNETLFEKRFYKLGLQRNREELAKSLNINLNHPNEAQNLEEKVAMELLTKELIEDDKDIIGDRSYNMGDHYNFRHLIYFEYFAILIKKKYEEEKVDYNINKNDNGFNNVVDDKTFKKSNDI